MTHSRQHALSAYRSAAAQVHPQVAVVRLFDVALRNIREAVLAAQQGQVEGGYVAVTRACQVLRGLYANLTGDTDMTETLKQTYLVNLLALNAAFGKKDAVPRFAGIASGLLSLRNAFAEIAGMPRANDLVAQVISAEARPGQHAVASVKR
jgi:flagellar secretion chaperone FliS